MTSPFSGPSVSGVQWGEESALTRAAHFAESIGQVVARRLTRPEIANLPISCPSPAHVSAFRSIRPRVSPEGRGSPALNTLAYPHVERPFPSDESDFTLTLTIDGQPATAFPVGLSREGLPIALQAIGPYLEAARRSGSRRCGRTRSALLRVAGGWPCAETIDSKRRCLATGRPSRASRGIIRSVQSAPWSTDLLRGLSPKFDMLQMMYHVSTPVGGDQP